jgi:hypothetical protein
MTTQARAAYVTRDTILKLLSDEEIARVSTAETEAKLTKGDEYVDLEHLDQGVLRADPAINLAMGHVVPRSAVSAASWARILAQLTT